MSFIVVGLAIVAVPESLKDVYLFSNGEADTVTLCQLWKGIDALAFLENCG